MIPEQPARLSGISGHANNTYSTYDISYISIMKEDIYDLYIYTLVLSTMFAVSEARTSS